MKKLFSLLLMTVMAVTAWAGTATLQYTGTTTGNMTGDNDAATLGVSADDWSVIGAKGGSNNLPGLNKDGTIRLYANKSDGNGNTITVTSLKNYTITSVTIDFKQGADIAAVTVNGSSVTGSNGTYAINATSFVIQNTVSGATTQVHMNSIEITYEEGGDPQPGGITAPTFSPAAGEVAYGTQVTITADEGCVIAMTTNGEDPTTSESAYVSEGNTATYPITQDVTIKAAAMDADLNFSNVVTAEYTVIRPEAPTFDPEAGAVEEGTTVTITAPVGCSVAYTTNGDDPTEMGESVIISNGVNVATVTVDEAMTIKAASVDDNMFFSEVVTAAYTISEPLGDNVVYYEPFTGTDGYTVNESDNFSGGAGNGSNIVYVSELGAWTAVNTFKGAGDAVKSGASSKKGSLTTPEIPVEAGKQYTLSFNAAPWNTEVATMNVEANAGSVGTISDAMTIRQWNAHSVSFTAASDAVKFTFSADKNRFFLDEVKLVLNAEQSGSDKVLAPVISGTTPFVGSTEVTITCATEDATIYYTTDGGDPSEEDAIYTEPFIITATTTVKAMAVKADMDNSDVTTKEFVAYPTVASIAEFNELSSGDNVGFSCPLVAIAQTGNYLYAQDDNNGILIFGGAGQEYTLGNVIPAGFIGTKATYGGAPEMTNPSHFEAASSTVEVTALELTLAQIKDVEEVAYGNYFGRYAVIKGATVTSSTITVGEESVSSYNRFSVSAPSDSEGKTYDVYGVVGYHNGVQFMPLEYVEVVEEPGITLAEALEGQEGEVKIGGELAVVLKCAGYAIVSDGNDWLKVYNLDAEEGDVVTNLAGTISGLDLNPVLIATASEAVTEPTVQAEPTKIDFEYATYDTMKQIKSNEVIELVGYYKDGYIYQAAKGNGMHIAVSTDNMTGNFAEGQQQHFTGVVTFKEAWTPANGAPARISQDSDDAYTNITFDVTEAGTVTGVNTVKAFNGKDVEAVYNVNGQRVSNMGKGVYILRHTDGTTTKVLR